MNKFAAYILFLLLFLGLSKSFSLSEENIIYVKNSKSLSHYFKGIPTSIILLSTVETGFFIKTFYHKYKVINGLRQPQIVIARVSPEFMAENKNNIGLSLFRRMKASGKISTVPMPPGLIFINDNTLGSWQYIDSGEKVWIFHNSYRHLSKILKWGSFHPTYSFYQKALNHLEQNLPYYGEHNEFGTNGLITQTEYTETFLGPSSTTMNLKLFLRRLLKPKSYWIDNE